MKFVKMYSDAFTTDRQARPDVYKTSTKWHVRQALQNFPFVITFMLGYFKSEASAMY